MSILSTIQANWNIKQKQRNDHPARSSQNKISIKEQIKVIKLNNKKKQRLASRSKNNKNSNMQGLAISLSTNKVIQKLTLFIKSIRLQTQKILQDKKIHYYLQISKTSQQQTKNNFEQYLKKFQDIVAAQEMANTNPRQYNGFLNQQHQDLRRFKSEEKPFRQPEFFSKKQIINQRKRDNQKILLNGNVVNLLIEYFESHMFPQTHWSNPDSKKNTKKDFQAKKVSQTCFFSSFDQNEQNFQLKRTQSLIYEQINRNSQQIELKQTEKFLKRPIQQTLQEILKLQDLKLIENMNTMEKVAHLFDLQSKMYVASQFIYSAAYMKNDITTLPKQYFKDVWKYINLNQLGDQKNITSSYRIMKKLMIITNASVINQLQTKSQQNSFLKKIVFGLSFPRYILQYNAARIKNQTFLRKPTIKMTKSIWNLPQDGFLKQLKKPFIFEMIAVNLQLYIPRGYSKQTNKDKKNKKIDIFSQKQNTIKVRLLNYKSLDLQNKEKNSQVFDTIIIHAHGGGFIALSSCTMQSYTRKWANHLKVPIFSIDYGKPPEHRYPIPVFDCLDVYSFITDNIHKYMNIKPSRIILAGDSAGGNLVCSLNALIMRENLHPVQSMFLAYPAVDTRKKFSPSRINSFNDAILYPTLLLLCMKQYLGDQLDYTQDPLANPILLTQSFVSNTSGDDRWPLKWPKTIIVVGKKDPLLDDSIRLCERLSSSQIQFHCQLYKNLSHAFLSIDKMVTQCEQTIKDSVKFLQMLLQKKHIGKKEILN